MSLWLYVLLCTTFTDNLPSYSSGVKECIERVIEIIAWLGWGLLLLAFIDMFFRFSFAKAAINRLKQLETMELSGKKGSKKMEK